MRLFTYAYENKGCETERETICTENKCKTSQKQTICQRKIKLRIEATQNVPKVI